MYYNMSMDISHVPNIKKVLTYPITLEKLAEYKAKKRGLPSVQSYIQYLIVKDTEDIIDEVEILNSEEIQKVGKAVGQIKTGQSITIKSKKELQKLLNSVSE